MSDYVMRVTKIEEAGYDAAMHGLAHNKKQKAESMCRVAEKLAKMDGGHNKFLESMIVWLDVQAPRYWWQEADTFRLSTKQSESTMHTLMKELTAVDINDDRQLQAFIDENFEAGACSIETLIWIYQAVNAQDLVEIKKRLPEGFLQKRLWCMSYKTLRNVITQRRHHRLPHWKSFISQTLEQLDHPELLPSLKKQESVSRPAVEV